MIASTSPQKAQEFLGSSPLFSHELNGRIPCRVERFICEQVRGTLPAMSDQLIGVQFSGARVFQETSEGSQLATHASVTCIFPINQETSWHISGAIDFAAIYLQPSDKPASRAIRKLLAKFTSPTFLRDPLLGALTRQLFTCLANPAPLDNRHCNTLIDTFFSQLRYLITQDKDSTFSSSSSHINTLQKVIAYIHDNLADDLSLQTLASLSGLSETYLRTIFQQTTGTTVHQYVLNSRLKQAYDLLLHTESPISRIAEETGFNSQSHFTSSFKKVYDVPPARFRRTFKGSVEQTGN